MSKQLTITFEDTTYTLCYTKRTCRNMEASGFVADELGAKPQTMIPLLVRGAFDAKHPFMDNKLKDRIYDSLRDKVGFIDALGELYNEPMLELIAEPEGDEKNAVTWKKNWT